MTLGGKIQALRKGRQMSQEQLADRLGVSRQSVSKWELDEAAPDIGNLVGIGALFGVSLDALIKEGEELPENGKPRAETECGRKADTRRGTAIGLGYGFALFLGLLIALILFICADTWWKKLGGVLIGGLAFLSLGQLIHLLIALRRK